MLTLFVSKSTEEKSQIEVLAELIIEVDDKGQLKSFSNKLKSFEENPETVFKDGSYYYDTANRRNQAYRGSSEDLKKYTEWFLLIDNLNKGGYLIEYDWKPFLPDIKYATNILSRKKAYNVPEISSDEDYSGLDTGGVLRKYNEVLRDHGYSMLWLYINSDSYPTILVRQTNVDKIIEMANDLGHKIIEY